MVQSVRKYDAAGNFLTMWGTAGSDPGEFLSPQAVDVDAQGRRYGPNGALSPNFKPWVAALARKVYQESLDGIAR